MTPKTHDTIETISGGSADADFWHSLVNETAAGKFLGLQPRTMQDLRQRGGGPIYVRISCRCVKYRRADLKAWADARLRASTSDDGSNASGLAA